MDTALLIIAPTITAIATVITAIAAFVKSKALVKAQADADCVERLKYARREAEIMADEVHRLRMKKAFEDED